MPSPLRSVTTSELGWPPSWNVCELVTSPPTTNSMVSVPTSMEAVPTMLLTAETMSWVPSPFMSTAVEKTATLGWVRATSTDEAVKVPSPLLR